jgi:hypothetical protein
VSLLPLPTILFSLLSLSTILASILSLFDILVPIYSLFPCLATLFSLLTTALILLTHLRVDPGIVGWSVVILATSLTFSLSLGYRACGQRYKCGCDGSGHFRFNG